MHVLEFIKLKIRPFVDQSALLQSAGFFAFRHFPFLLPHDPEYLGLSKLSLEESSGLFLDVGANIGLSALTCHRLLPLMSIFAVEPNPANERALATIEKNNSLFTYRICAAGNSEGMTKLFVPRLGRFWLHTMASMCYDSLIASLASSAAPRGAATKALVIDYDVHILTIDSLNLNPTIMKIDVEGFENDVLEGALRTLRESRPIVLLEINDRSFEHCRSLLSSMDYALKYYCTQSSSFTPDSSNKRNAYFIPIELMNKIGGNPARNT